MMQVAPKSCASVQQRADWCSMRKRWTGCCGDATVLFERLDRASLAAQRRLTVPFLRQVLESERSS